MIVAIHQPNYLPWLGYFAKLAQADAFVFLDDVQYSKNSYINRVQILNKERRHWLTVPVHASLNDEIRMVHPAKPGWVRSHCDTLANFYRKSAFYRDVWADLSVLYEGLPATNIAESNIRLIEFVAHRLGLECEFLRSSSIDTGSAVGDERLAQIVKSVAPEGVYLSGAGGKNYQEENTFKSHGLTLQYSRFSHPQYAQDIELFEAGLSVADSVFRLGWSATRDLILASVR